MSEAAAERQSHASVNVRLQYTHSHPAEPRKPLSSNHPVCIWVLDSNHLTYIFFLVLQITMPFPVEFFASASSYHDHEDDNDDDDDVY